MERRLSLCLRRFSDCTARFLADISQGPTPKIFYEDNSKAEKYAFLALCCQWICANKRRLYERHFRVVMARDFTSFVPWNTPFREFFPVRLLIISAFAIKAQVYTPAS